MVIPKNAVKKSFLKWLDSDKSNPKTWSDLLDTLSGTDKFSAAAEEIRKKLAS